VKRRSKPQAKTKKRRLDLFLEFFVDIEFHMSTILGFAEAPNEEFNSDAYPSKIGGLPVRTR
jgi:hypothetical protein